MRRRSKALLLLAAAALVAVQAWGWRQTGHAVAASTQALWRVTWPVARIGWPLLAAAALIAGGSTPLRGLRSRAFRAARRRWRLGLLAVAAPGLLVAVLLLGPRWLVAHDTNTRALNAEQRAKATNDVRATLLQAVGGLLLLVGAVGTFRQLTVSREGQVTERFTRAIDQLGSDKHQLDVTLGGIYALERIAKDSPADQTTIAEILTAYVCGHAPWPPTLPGQPPEDTPAGEARECPPDVQAAMTVLGRMPRPTGERHRLMLRRVDLRGVDLSGANLRGATLLGAHLEGAILLQTQLDGADLRFTHLDGAYLGQAHLDGAYLREACLERAHLVGAYLEGANLEGAKLQGAYMQDARASAATIWPDGRNSDATTFPWKAARIKL